MSIKQIEHLETQEYATTLAGVLATISTISFAFMIAVGKDSQYIMILIFAFVGVLSTSGVGLILDYVLDQAQVENKRRWSLLGGGYMLFSLLIGALLFGILLMLNIYSQLLENNLYIFFCQLVLSILSAIMVTSKLMTRKEKWPLRGMRLFLPATLFISIFGYYYFCF